MDNNVDLNKLVMDKVDALNRTYADYNTGLAATPEIEAYERARTFGQDQPLKDLKSGFSSKVQELYNYDKNRAASMTQQATFNGEAMVTDPSVLRQYDQSKINQIVSEKEKAWQLYEERQTLLGNVVDKALKLYQAQLDGKKAEIEQAKDERDYAARALEFSENLKIKKEELELKKAEDKKSAEGKYFGVDTATPEQLSKIDFNKVDDAEVVAMAKEVYGPNVKLGTQSQAPAFARRLMNQYKQGGYDIQVLTSTMDAPTKAMFNDSIKFINDSKKVLPNLKSQNIYGSLGERTTGPLASIFGPYMGQGKDSMEATTRQLIDQMSAEKVHEFYGGAFTSSEMQRAGWLPGSTRQESTNATSIQGMVDSAESKIRSALTLQGITGPAQDKVVNYVLSQGQTTTAPSGTGIQVGKYQVEIEQ